MAVIPRRIAHADKPAAWPLVARAKAGAFVMLAFIVLASGSAFAGSAASVPAPATHPGRFVSQQFGITLVYPHRIRVLEHFPSSYLMPQPRWNHRGPRHVPGQALVALKLPGSNAAKRGLLRLGVSDTPKAVQDCLFTPAEIKRWLPGVNKVRHVRIDHVYFQMVTSGSAAAGHDMSERLYRGVHNGLCIAVDLIVAGSWAVDEKPAFSTDEAVQRLTGLLQGLHFVK